MDPALMSRSTFEAVVIDALDELPDWVIPIVAEIAVLVEDEQPEEDATPGVMCLGRYRGVPRNRYGGRPPGSMPDTITLYRKPILITCRSPQDVPTRVLTVLGHEVGHALGMSEVRLRELGWF